MSRMISICFLVFLLITILTPSYGQATCATGWVLNGGSCYLFAPPYNPGGGYGPKEGRWSQCHDYCPTSYPSATMLCVRNAAENTWIASQNGRSYWIGYTDMLPYGGGKGTKQYAWVTGCSSTYTNWWTDAGQPDNGGNNEDYTVVYPLHSGLWKDHSPGDEEFYCGCQYNLALTNTPSSRPTAYPSSRLTADPSSSSPSSSTSDVPSSAPSAAPSSRPTSSPTATPSFRPSTGDVSE